MAALRIGHGYDAHRLKQGRKLVLGGVEIPCEMGLDGHSDADVLAHAAMDALLGALALGDIGAFFPDSDMSFRDANSIGLLKRVAELISGKGFRVGNLDATIVAERPRISEYVARMRNNLADALAVEPQAVSVKATTEEGMGFTGAGMGIAAHCVVLLERME